MPAKLLAPNYFIQIGNTMHFKHIVVAFFIETTKLVAKLPLSLKL